MASAISSRAPRRYRTSRRLRVATTDKGAVVNVDAPYAGPIHWGWEARGIPENRWATDAARATEPAWISEYETEITRALGQGEGGLNGLATADRVDQR